MPLVGPRSGSSNTNIDALFDTTPARPAAPPPPAQLSPEMKQHLLSRIQEERGGRNGYGPANVGGETAEKLRDAVKSGDVVQVRVNQNIVVLLKKSDDLEQSKSFFYKTSGGFAGEQFFGPFDV